MRTSWYRMEEVGNQHLHGPIRHMRITPLHFVFCRTVLMIRRARTVVIPGIGVRS